MGIDTHALNFIRYAQKKHVLGRVATLGRQGLMVLRAYAEAGPYCEEFLKRHFGATLVHSYDYSDYEGATYVVDMNKSFCPSAEYDTVLDCGSTEHIYNAPQAFLNLSRLCVPGGQILHVAPANNFCGHGFWQFSPELFFSLYSSANGYDQTEVFLADVTDTRSWFEVKRPSNGQRAEVLSCSPLYILCRTVKAGDVSHVSVQQSDYVHEWNSDPPSKANRPGVNRLKQIIKKRPWLYVSLLSANVRLKNTRSRLGRSLALSSRNPHLTRHKVSELLARE